MNHEKIEATHHHHHIIQVPTQHNRSKSTQTHHRSTVAMQHFFTLLLGLAALSLGMHPSSGTVVEFDVCPNAMDGLGIKSIELDPFPAVAGQDLIISVEGESSVEFGEGTTITMSIRVGSLPAPPATYDLCEALKQTSNLKCPVQPGTASAVVLGYSVPRVAPEGTATSTVRTRDAQGKEISCIQLSIPVVRQSLGIAGAAVSLLGHGGGIGGRGDER